MTASLSPFPPPFRVRLGKIQEFVHHNCEFLCHFLIVRKIILAFLFLQEAVLSSSSAPSLPCVTSLATVNLDHRLASSLPFSVAASSMTIPQPAPQASIAPFHANLFSQAGPLARTLASIGPKDLGLHSSPAREEGEVPESELDPDTRRRLLILQHGQDMREGLPNEPPFPGRPPVQAPVAGPGSGPVPVPGPVPVAGPGSASISVPGPGPVPMSGSVPAPAPVPVPVPRVQSRGSWFQVEDHMNPSPLGRSATKEFPMSPDAVHVEKQRPPPPFPRKVENPVWSDRSFPEKQRLPREVTFVLIHTSGLLLSNLKCWCLFGIC